MGIKYRNEVHKTNSRSLVILATVVFGIIISIVILHYLNLNRGSFEVRAAGVNAEQPTSASYTGTAANGGTTEKVSSDVGFTDPRAYVLDQYFKANNSPLYGTGRLFVEACDRHGAPRDCTTVAAIARAETDLCKYGISATYYNCWGFGGGGKYRMKFNSWEESIDLVTSRLVHNYGESYMIDPSKMERTFCGWEAGCTNWGKRVKFFINEISQYALKVGMDKPLLAWR